MIRCSRERHQAMEPRVTGAGCSTVKPTPETTTLMALAMMYRNNYPTNVSVEFNGHFVNGHVVGAFGAEYDQ